MGAELRIGRPLYQEVLSDLRREHPFAFERVGFVKGRLAWMGENEPLVLIHGYRSIPDEQYVRDDNVGARIGEEAMAQAMVDAYYGDSSKDGVFHIHLHDHGGEPDMSRTDARELPAMMPGFQAVGKSSSHGIIILSANHGASWIWLPGSKNPFKVKRVVVAGAPLCVFEEGRRW